MKTYLVVTMTCPDRPGIVEAVTEQVLSHSANWEDSRMARLGGDFAGIILLSVDETHAEELKQALLNLSDDETTVTVKATREMPATPSPEERLFQLGLSGADHEGIVHKVSAYLANQGINVESMESNVAPAPMSASPLFHMTATIKVPGGVNLEQLSKNLDHIGDEEGVDIHVKPINQ
ncbi:MAG: glycine cleavage system protein R [Planctomycetota bacterium]